MARYADIGIKPMPFTADADLTAKQWMLVSPASTAGNVVATSSACNPIPLGILVNDPSAGQGAEVVIFGPTKAKCRVTTCDLKNGRFLKAASDGFLEAMTSETSEFPFARYFDASKTTTDASAIGEVFVYGFSSCGLQLGTS